VAKFGEQDSMRTSLQSTRLSLVVMHSDHGLDIACPCLPFCFCSHVFALWLVQPNCADVDALH